MSTAGKVTALVALSAGLALAPSALALGPGDFAVDIPNGPTQMSPPSNWQPTPECTPALPTGIPTSPPSPGPYNCTLPSYRWSESAAPLTGTVTEVATGKPGTIALLCDYNLAMSMKVAIMLTNPLSPTSKVSEFTGTGGQACSWEIKVGESGLIGTLEGTTALTQVNDTTGRFTGTFGIVVTGGTGDYANANGVGQFTQVQDFPFPTPTAPPVPTGLPTGAGGIPGGIPGMQRSAMEAAIVRAVSHQAGGSPMKMALRSGKPKATLIIPKGPITTTTKWKVHMAAAPGVSCSVAATKGSTKKNLGKLKKVKTGQLVGKSFAPKVLGKGSWKLTPTCTTGGKALTKKQAKARTITVA